MKSRSNWRPDLRESDADDEKQGPSKTELKQTMHELQELGVALVELPAARLDELGMEERLRDALTELQRLKTFEAIRRQSQFIGKMLRETDPEPFRRAIAAYRLGESLALQQAESWRTRLLADDAAVTEWMELYPGTNAQQFRSLIRNVRREQAQSQASVTLGGVAGKGKLYRELFRKLRVELQQAIDHPG